MPGVISVISAITLPARVATDFTTTVIAKAPPTTVFGIGVPVHAETVGPLLVQLLVQLPVQLLVLPLPPTPRAATTIIIPALAEARAGIWAVPGIITAGDASRCAATSRTFPIAVGMDPVLG